MQSYYNASSEIVFYQDKNIIITEVYTVVFGSSNTSTIRMQDSLVIPRALGARDRGFESLHPDHKLFRL